MGLILTNSDATYASEIFINFFEKYDRIDDYQRDIKQQRMATAKLKTPSTLPGCAPEDDIFDDFSLNPKDMGFKLHYNYNQESYDSLLDLTTSHITERAMVGKRIIIVVEETTTGKICGVIRLGSPMINSKPRNEFFGGNLDLKLLNKHAIMGFIIVPMQPFGFNYLGGKLLALMCCTHEIREHINQKYGSEICLFETTSLYGNLKTCSQYDGLKPFLRYKGLTDSKFTPLLNDDRYRNLNKWFTSKNDGTPLVPAHTPKGIVTASRKLKIHMKMIAILKNSLSNHNNQDQLKLFTDSITKAQSMTNQKRFYMSSYGYENVVDVMTGKTQTLVPAENSYKYTLDNVVEWWRNKAEKRYSKLAGEDRVRTELELWSDDENIDIIR
mgnify:FL=1